MILDMRWGRRLAANVTGTEQFVASLVHSLAWPAAVVGLAVVFKAQLSRLIDHPLRRLRAGPAGLELEFDRVLATVEADVERPGAGAREWPLVTVGAEGAGVPEPFGEVQTELAGLARQAPAAAILEAFARVERLLQELLKDKIKFPSALGANALAQSALSHGLISPQNLSAIQGIAVLRNLAAHNLAGVAVEQALEYLSLVDAVLYSLQRPPGGQGG
jgi:hypothetical protein